MIPFCPTCSHPTRHTAIGCPDPYHAAPSTQADKQGVDDFVKGITNRQVELDTARVAMAEEIITPIPDHDLRKVAINWVCSAAQFAANEAYWSIRAHEAEAKLDLLHVNIKKLAEHVANKGPNFGLSAEGLLALIEDPKESHD